MEFCSFRIWFWCFNHYQSHAINLFCSLLWFLGVCVPFFPWWEIFGPMKNSVNEKMMYSFDFQWNQFACRDSCALPTRTRIWSCETRTYIPPTTTQAKLIRMPNTCVSLSCWNDNADAQSFIFKASSVNIISSASMALLVLGSIILHEHENTHDIYLHIYALSSLTFRNRHCQCFTCIRMMSRR